MHLLYSAEDFLKAVSGEDKERNDLKREIYIFFNRRYLERRKYTSFYSLYKELKGKINSLDVLCSRYGLAKDKYEAYISVLTF